MTSTSTDKHPAGCPGCESGYHPQSVVSDLTMALIAQTVHVSRAPWGSGEWHLRKRRAEQLGESWLAERGA